MFFFFIYKSISAVCLNQNNETTYRCTVEGGTNLSSLSSESDVVEIPGWVTGIGQRLIHIKRAQKVIFENPSNIKYLSESSFDCFFRLNTVENFPLIDIPYRMFFNCFPLINFTFFGQKLDPSHLIIPKEISSIDGFAFTETSFEKITFEGSNTFVNENTFSSLYNLRSISNFSIQSIPSDIFNLCKSLIMFTFLGQQLDYGHLIFPTGIKLIGQKSFSYTKFYKITFESSTIIESWAFSNINSLTNVNNFPIIPIPDFIFIDSSIKNFTFFSQSLIIETLQIPSSITVIGIRSFEHTHFSHIIFENSSINIKFGHSAFSHMPNLISVLSFPYFSQISENLFYGSSKLNIFSKLKNTCNGFHFYSELQSIPMFAFYGTNFSCYSAPSDFDVSPFLPFIGKRKGFSFEICEKCYSERDEVLKESSDL